MLFPTSGFLLFFLVVAAAMAMLETRFTAKKAVLVVASYYFYAQWDWRFCFLLAFSSSVSYLAGRLIGATANRARRRLVLGVAITLHLGLLGAFKYLDFFVLSAKKSRYLKAPSSPRCRAIATPRMRRWRSRSAVAPISRPAR